jgi:hypothetical protein
MVGPELSSQEEFPLIHRPPTAGSPRSLASPMSSCADWNSRSVKRHSRACTYLYSVPVLVGCPGHRVT